MTRTSLLRRALSLALALPLVAIAGAQAETTVIGNPSQSSSQASTMSQTGNNIVAPLPVVGTNHSSASQTGISSLSDGEAIAPTGGSVIGNSNQMSDQGSVGTQLDVGSKTMTNVLVGNLSNGQLIGAGLILGDSRQANRQGDALNQKLTGSKVATDTEVSLGFNTQLIGDGAGVIIGSTGQTNLQGDTTAQSVSQKASNPTIGNSTLTATTVTVSHLANTQGVQVGTLIGAADQTNSQGHDGSQTVTQASAPVITGNYAPIADTVSVVHTGNCQTVDDGSKSCLLVP